MRAVAMDQTQTRPDLAGIRVLIVEDSWTIAHSMQVALERAGAIVVGPVGTVSGALEALQKTAVDVALVDMNLRDSFADPAIETLRRMSIPYAIVTAYDALPSVEMSAAPVVLNKPVEDGTLVEEVSRLVGRHWAARH